MTEAISRGGILYVPFHSPPIAAGPFLQPCQDSVEFCLVLPPSVQFGIRDRVVGGIRSHKGNLFAGRLSGDSMTGIGAYNGDRCIFERPAFAEVRSGQIVLIERLGAEEGFGSWALKRLIIERPRRAGVNPFGDEIEFDDQVVVLRSHNPSILPWRLDPSGQYRIAGLYRRVYNGMLIPTTDVPQ